MGKHELGFLLTKETASRKRTRWGAFHFKEEETDWTADLSVWSEDTPALTQADHFIYGGEADAERERCIWEKFYCLSSFSTARLWALLFQPVPPWISTMWNGRGSRRYEGKFWANSGWRLSHTPWDRARSRIKSRRCITAPRSCWRSCGGTGSRVVARTTLRQSTTPRRSTNSTWSTDQPRTVSITVIYGT